MVQIYVGLLFVISNNFTFDISSRSKIKASSLPTFATAIFTF